MSSTDFLTPSDANSLQDVRLFEGLTPEAIAQVVRAARLLQLEEDQYLFHQGDPADHIFTLLTGRVKLSQVTPDGQQVILRMAGPKDTFAVVAVLSELELPVSAQALEASSVLGWDRETMHDLMLRFPHLALNALKVLSARTREFQDRIRELATERVERRIARTVLRLVRQTGRKVPEGVLLDLTLTRQDLAELSGTTLFTVSRTLSQWESQGLIQTGREKIIILSPHSLVTIAEDLPPGVDPETASPFPSSDA